MNRERVSTVLAALLVATAVFPGDPAPLGDPFLDALSGRWTLSPHHTLVERLLPTGRELHPWTVNTPRRIRALAALGIPSLTTDDPERALHVLETWNGPNDA